MRFLAAVLCLRIFLTAAAAAAQPTDWLRRDVAYSATRNLYFEDGGVLSGPVWYDGGKERFEMILQDQPQVFIRREDEGRLYMMMPQLGMAMVVKPGSRKAMPSARDYANLQPEEIGRETVAGEAATKYRVMVEGRTIFIWATEDGIPLRMEDESAEARFVIELTDLKRGPQPGELFEVPAGVQNMPISGQ
ncbi:hypothetical protein [Pelagibius sp. 7325]|uniref:hypothetical protein n=1 Tax=Pelagibius sp. 7325 TaxID=3131994 RepID=UPI0030EB21C7